MSKVYEALKRAAEQRESNGSGVADLGEGARHDGEDKNGRGGGANLPLGEDMFSLEPIGAPDRLLDNSPFFGSASTAHTENENVGSALPDELNSRAAGATLDAVGETRAPDFDTLEINDARVEPHLVAITQPQSAHTEIYRSLRTRILHAHERRNMQAFVITSAGPAEGKTMTALNLGWMLAQTGGVRALLIEGDLRRPCTADYLGVNGAIGLAEVLAGESRLEDAILRLEPAGLHLLPGGSSRDDVAELLSGPRFRTVLAEARRWFNYILIDAPPLGIFTDASVMMNRADGALLVVRAGQTRYGDLDELLAPLRQEMFLGVVLNGAEEQSEKVDYYQRRYYRAAIAASPENALNAKKEGEGEDA